MSARVIVVGSINVDLVIRVPRLPKPGETVIGGSFSRSHGGKGANKAVAAATLGAATFMIGAVGDDAFGKEARGALEQAGVNTSRLLISASPTGVAQIFVDEAGENMIAVASGANYDLNGQLVRERLAGLLTPGSVVISNLEIPESAVLAAAVAARESGCTFILNPAPARPLSPELLPLCDVLTPNEHEVDSLGWSSVDAILEGGVGAVIVTRGAEGAYLYRPGAKVFHQPAFPIHVVDTTGAGDAFSATLAWALSEGHSLPVAIRLAAAGGALATRQTGARGSLASREEVERLSGIA